MNGRFREAVDRGLAPGGNLTAELVQHADYTITTAEEAGALDDAMNAIITNTSLERAAFRVVLGLMQAIEGQDAYHVLLKHSVPRLAAFVEQVIGQPEDPDLILFALKILAMYQAKVAPTLIARAALLPDLNNHSLWPTLFRAFDAPHPHRRELAEALAASPPDSRAGVTALNFCTSMVQSGELVFHPYDVPAGITRIASWLEASPCTDRFAPVVAGLAPDSTAAAALAYIRGSERDRLLDIGLTHISPRVRLESAIVASRLGYETSLNELAELSRDVRYAYAACTALEFLGREDLIAASMLNSEFKAVAEFAEWLSHPLEYGRPPDQIELLDSRELLWPPANDLRRLYLVQYGYDADEPSNQLMIRGVGLVGSITFELRGETTPEMSPLDFYALHCCWELQVSNDPRAPQNRSISAGRRILGLAI
jgi:hypothetical protein